MASTVTKIYELKTLGYDEVIRQLTNIETSFKNIHDLKKALNQQKIVTTDADALAQVNKALDEAKLKTQQLRLERQLLINEAKALQNANTAQANASKAVTSAVNAEANN